MKHFSELVEYDSSSFGVNRLISSHLILPSPVLSLAHVTSRFSLPHSSPRFANYSLLRSSLIAVAIIHVDFLIKL